MKTEQLRDVPKIETLIWEKQDNGYLKKTGNRPIGEVAADLEKALKSAKLPFEYISPEDKWWPWPEGETFVALEVGGNEGYSLYVCVREYLKDAHNRRSGKMELRHPIRIKLLTTTDEAFEVHRFVWHLLGS